MKLISSMVLVPITIMVLLSTAAAGDLELTLEYYHSQDPEIVDRVSITKVIQDKQKQKLYDDLLTADDSSKQTLTTFLDILESYEAEKLRQAMTLRSRIFARSYVVPENRTSSQSDFLPGGRLYVQITVDELGNHQASLGMKIIYNDRELFSDRPKSYPLDRPVVLSDVNSHFRSSEEADLLILRIAKVKS